jgi:iron complex transport system substrate-binding protein
MRPPVQSVRLTGFRTNLRGPRPDVQRIVSISPSNTEILHALGLGRRIVGVDRWSDYPPRVRKLPRIGSDLHVDTAQVAALEPDLVVASLHVPGMENNIAAFEQAGFRYLALGGQGLSGVWDDIRTIGQYLGREPRAEKIVSDARARMAAVAGRYASIPMKPRVHWEWSSHPYVAGCQSWITELLEMAGASNAYAHLDTETARISADDALARGAEVLVACWCGYTRPPSTDVIARRRGWDELPAIRDGRIIVLKEDLFGRPGPRLADGLEQLALLLHPETRSTVEP